MWDILPPPRELIGNGKSECRLEFCAVLPELVSEDAPVANGVLQNQCPMLARNPCSIRALACGGHSRIATLVSCFLDTDRYNDTHPVS